MLVYIRDPSGEVPVSTADTDVFDVFCGSSERNAIWLEAVIGLSKAKDRMQAIAAAEPGDYFVYHVATKTVLSRISNGPSKSGRKHRSKSGAA